AQGGWSTNILHTMHESAIHAGEVIRTALDRGAAEIEPTPEAEETWWQWVATGLPYAYDQMKECTPSWLNSEGKRDNSKYKLAIYMGPLSDYVGKMREWREAGMPGLEFK